MSNYLLLNKEIYEKDSILFVINVFGQLCNIKLEDEDNYYRCLFLNCVNDEELTRKEFENYLINYSCSRL